MNVIILAAGRGTRMKNDLLHKALLPYRGKAILSHIIEQFPPDARFTVAVRHHAAQLEEYLHHAHPDAIVNFVDVGSVDEPGAGPGKSLQLALRCVKGPAVVVTSDTYFELPRLVKWDRNWLGVGAIPLKEQLSYCNLLVDKYGEVNQVRDKQPANPSYLAWTGVMYLHDWEKALVNLDKATATGEVQCSAAWKDLRFWGLEHRWLDFGTKERYDANTRAEGYDYSKPDEQTYLVSGKVVKFFADAERARKRRERWHLLQEVTPTWSNAGVDHFMSYDLVPGKTFYEAGDPYKFQLLLSWLQAKLWRQSYIEERGPERCFHFYHDKTLHRTLDYLQRAQRDATTVNGEPLELSWPELLAKIDWSALETDGFVPFHGDLQFDNIIVSDATRFTLIDWRDDFDGCMHGDVHYDLAKLLSGITFDFDLVKKNMFSVTYQGTHAHVTFARRTHNDQYATILRKFCEAQGYDGRKVNLLRWLVLASMSGLHKEPFAEALYLYSLAGALRLYRNPNYKRFFDSAK